MSHYARLLEPLADLPAGTAIRRVELTDAGYVFEALEPNGKWSVRGTTADLPALTDKGRDARAKRANGALRQGRPRVSAEPSTKRLVCKVTEQQHAAVEAIAVKEETNVPGLIRKALIERGMPE